MQESPGLLSLLVEERSSNFHKAFQEEFFGGGEIDNENVNTDESIEKGRDAELGVYFNYTVTYRNPLPSCNVNWKPPF